MLASPYQKAGAVAHKKSLRSGQIELKWNGYEFQP